MANKNLKSGHLFVQTKKIPKGAKIEQKELLRRLKNIPPLVDIESKKEDD